MGIRVLQSFVGFLGHMLASLPLLYCLLVCRSGYTESLVYEYTRQLMVHGAAHYQSLSMPNSILV
jgi:hypothetical protein